MAGHEKAKAEKSSWAGQGRARQDSVRPDRARQAPGHGRTVHGSIPAYIRAGNVAGREK
jgi:hypothetical protein